MQVVQRRDMQLRATEERPYSFFLLASLKGSSRLQRGRGLDSKFDVRAGHLSWAKKVYVPPGSPESL